jgi:anti-sigma regulatory factor (Ser/Thr protein kinase)
MAVNRLGAAPLPRTGAARRHSLALPGEPSAVPRARRFVREVLIAWDRRQYEEAGLLLVSELVGNAVLHARTVIGVEVIDLDDGVLLSVADGSTVLPVLRRHSREAATGRGLWLLDQYSAARGVQQLPGGKSIWAVLCPEVPDPQEGADSAMATWLDAADGL